LWLAEKNMTDDFDILRAKVADIFHELVGEKANQLFISLPPSADLIGQSLTDDLGVQRAEAIGFHLTDWTFEAAFLIAISLFPERFTPAEVEIGVGMLIIHALNHLAAAAKIYGQPIQDVFNLGQLTEEDS
jgi:hypothetical protein